MGYFGSKATSGLCQPLIAMMCVDLPTVLPPRSVRASRFGRFPLCVHKALEYLYATCCVAFLPLLALLCSQIRLYGILRSPFPFSRVLLLQLRSGFLRDDAHAVGRPWVSLWPWAGDESAGVAVYVASQALWAPLRGSSRACSLVAKVPHVMGKRGDRVSGHCGPWLRGRAQCDGGSWWCGPRSDRRGASANSDFHIRGVSSTACLAGCTLIRWSTSTR